VTAIEHLTPLEPRYPSRLRTLDKPPLLSAQGGSLEASCVVAIVGSRRAHRRMLRYARGLARRLARAGVVVASGGALGIDGAAHAGALEGGGRTWLVAGSGCLHRFPPDHEDLYDAIGSGPGAVLWPFAPEMPPAPARFRARNTVLACLADAVVVVQAGDRSGALHAAGCARRIGKALWVVAVPPWLGEAGFDGSRQLMRERSAQVLTSTLSFFRSLGISCPGNRAAAPQTGLVPLKRPLTVDESAVIEALATPGQDPFHLDEIMALAALSPQTARAVLLTLALENVVVEGPPGFFRRRDGL
jgi:DNA processing protein